MFLLALCFVGTALAAPAIPEDPLIAAESHILMSPYITYPSPILPLRTLMIEAEPKEEGVELTEEPKELPKLPEAPELPKLEDTKPIVVKLDTSKPLSYFTNWINSLPSFNLPSLPFINGFFPSSNGRVLMPSYYPGYAPLIVDPTKLK